jgi:hypothetical protein
MSPRGDAGRMGSATWRCEARLDAAPDAVYAWMSDLTADDHNSAAYKRGAGVDPAKKQKPATREVLSREGNVLRVRDTWNGSTWEQTVTLDPTARTVRIQGGMGYDATWRAAPAGAGTRLSVEGQMGRGLVGSLMKLFQGRMQREMQADFNGHVEDLRESLGKGS